MQFQSSELHCVQMCWLDNVVTVRSAIVIPAAVHVGADFCGGGLKIWVAHTHRTSPWVTSDVKKCYKPKEREVLSQTPETPTSLPYSLTAVVDKDIAGLDFQPDFLRDAPPSLFQPCLKTDPALMLIVFRFLSLWDIYDTNQRFHKHNPLSSTTVATPVNMLKSFFEKGLLVVVIKWPNAL